MCEAPDLADTLIARNMLRDLVPCADFSAFAESMGFVPASEEVSHIEHTQSHMRRKNIEPVIPAILNSADCAGRIANGFAEHAHGMMPPGSLEAHTAICRMAALAVISHLVDFGYLVVPRG